MTRLQPGEPPAPEPLTLEQAFAQLLVDLEAELETRGWDQPSGLWSLELGEEGGLPWGDLPGGGSLGGLRLREIERFGEHPIDRLRVQYAPDDALGVVLCVEGWTYPPDSDPVLESSLDRSPSEHPRRVELRHLVGMLRDGTIISAGRARGADPEVHMAVELEGPLIENLRCYLHAPAPPEVTERLRGPYVTCVLDVVESYTNQMIDLSAALVGTGEVGGAAEVDLDEVLVETGSLLLDILHKAAHDPEGFSAEVDASREVPNSLPMPRPADTWADVQAAMIGLARAAGNPDAVARLSWLDPPAVARRMGAERDVTWALAALGTLLGEDVAGACEGYLHELGAL